MSDELKTAVLDGGEDPVPRPVAPLDARYTVVEEIARGGIGRILRTEDARLGREVALKRLIDPLPEHRRRFTAEAKITARLAHPAIVPVYDADDLDGGDPYYTMKLVSGRSMAEVIQQTTSFSERIALLPRVAAVADAIAYAHSRRIIHRDLKPSNVLLGDFGETIVIDWGLAKDLDAAEAPSTGEASHDSSLTSVGQVVGTPAYMAPEQAAGRPLDARADVYALGALLYHTLTGAPPYRDVSRDELIPRIIAGPPPPIATREPQTPRDLAAIVTKATAHDPARRYPDAGELAEDLRRFTTGQLVGAFAYSRPALLRRWLRRHRMAVTVGAVLGALLLATGIVSINRIVAARNVAEASANELRLAQARAILPRDPTAAIAWLKTHQPTDATWAAAQATALQARSDGVARDVFATDVADPLVAFAPRADLVVVAGGGKIGLLSPRTGALRLIRVGGTFTDLALAPAGDLVVAGTTTGRVWLVRTDGGASVSIDAHASVVTFVGFRPDGERVLTFGADGKLGLWRRDGTAEASATVPGGYGLCAAWRGDEIVVGSSAGQLLGWRAGLFEPLAAELGECVALVVDETRVALIDADGVAPVGQPRVPVAQTSVVHTVHGKLALGGADGTVTVVERDWTAPRVVAGGGDPVGAVALSEDGRRVAAGSSDGVRVIDASGTRWLRGHMGRIRGLAFFGDELISVGDDGTVRRWSVVPEGAPGFGDAGDGVYQLAWIDDAHLITGSYKGAVVVWDRAGKAQRRPGHGGAAVVASAGGVLASSGEDGVVEAWELGEPRVLARLGVRVTSVALTGDGAQVAAGTIDDRVAVIASRGGEPRILKAADEVGVVAFAPHRPVLMVAGRSPDLQLLGQSGLLSFHGHAQAVFRVVWSPLGERVASASGDHTARLWRPLSHGESVVLGHEAPLTDVAFVDEQRVVTATRAGEVILWDGANRVRRLEGHTGWVLDVATSPDGRFAASAGADGTARLWELETGSASILRGHEGRVKRVAFSPDGRTLATAGEDGRVRLWPVEVPAVPRERFRAWLDEATSARLDGAGRLRSVAVHP